MGAFGPFGMQMGNHQTYPQFQRWLIWYDCMILDQVAKGFKWPRQNNQDLPTTFRSSLVGIPDGSHNSVIQCRSAATQEWQDREKFKMLGGVSSVSVDTKRHTCWRILDWKIPYPLEKYNLFWGLQGHPFVEISFKKRCYYIGPWSEMSRASNRSRFCIQYRSIAPGSPTIIGKKTSGWW